jgi:hypothetical protein
LQAENFYQLKIKLLLRYGQFEDAQKYIEVLGSKGFDRYKLVTYEIDVLISSGNFEEAEKVLLSFKTCSQIKNHLEPKKVAFIFFSLNKSYQDSELLLGYFFDPPIIETELKKIYAGTKITEVTDTNGLIKKMYVARSINSNEIYLWKGGELISRIYKTNPIKANKNIYGCGEFYRKQDQRCLYVFYIYSSLSRYQCYTEEIINIFPEYVKESYEINVMYSKKI